MAHCKALPVHLMVRILKYLGTDEGYKEAAVMRSVSKEWLEAFRECPGHLHTDRWMSSDLPWAKDDSEIARLCSFAPSMSALSISSETGNPLILQPLAACTQLKEVDVSSGQYRFSQCDYSDDKFVLVDLNGIPGCVLRLHLYFRFHTGLAGLETFHNATVKQLVINYEEHGQGEELDKLLLDCLPGLQELQIEAPSWQRGKKVAFSVDSLLALSKLKLRDCKFRTPKHQLTALRNLSLERVSLNGKKLATAFQAFSGLLHLTLRHCTALRPRRLTAVSLLRTLALHGSAPAFIALAPDNLQSLECNWDITAPLAAYRHQRPQPPPAERLGSLTRLKLSCGGYCDRADHQPINAALLQGLPIRELVLVNCSLTNHTQLSTLFVEGALNGLQKLHIEDRKTKHAIFLNEMLHSTDSPMAAKEEHQAKLQTIRRRYLPHLEMYRTVGDGIIHLSQLQQVSGYSAVWNFGVDDVLKAWEMKSGIDEPLVDGAFELYRSLPTSQLRVWSKP